MASIFIGIGGTGDWVLTYLKEKVRSAYGEVPSHIQFRLIDTLAPDQRNNTAARLGNSVGIQAHEYLQLADHPPGNFYNLARQVAEQPTARPELSRWFKADLFTQHLAQADFNLVRGAGQHRQFGRMGMFLNKQQVLNMMQKALQDCNATGETAIWIIGSVAGGTGAGTFPDMALLARKAVQMTGGAHRILGVAVLPSVFGDVMNEAHADYSHQIARSYAVMREFARFQAPVKSSDWGRDADSKKPFRFQVDYDAATKVLQETQLFDSLVLYDQPCNNEDDRRSYYSQIADGLSLMLDQAVGNKLFASWINAEEGYAACFNSHRMFLPARLFEHLFRNEAMLSVIDGLLPLADSGVPKAGALDDRRQEAWEFVQKESGALLGRLAKLENKPDFDQLDKELLPKFIIDTLLGFGNPDLVYGTEATPAVKEQARKLCRALSEGLAKYGDQDNPDDYPTSKESAVKGVAKRRQLYEGDGQHSFAEGLRIVRPVVRKRIEGYMDEALLTAIRRYPATAEGLGRLAIICQEMVNVLHECRERAQQLGNDNRAVLQKRQKLESDAKTEMENTKKPLFGKGELPRKQQDYFDAANAVQYQWQKIQLMEVIEDLIKVAQNRLDSWQEKIREWQRALDKVRQEVSGALKDIHAELERHTLTVQSSSLGISNRPEMDGYREELKRRCLVDPQTGAALPEKLLGGLQWRNTPEGLRLFNWPGRGETGLLTREITDALRVALEEPIAENMRKHEGMANYLEWLRSRRPTFLTELTEKLVRAINGLPDQKQTTATRKFLLLHGDQWNPQVNIGENVFEQINSQLRTNTNISQRGLENNLRDADGRILFKDANTIALLVTDNRIEYKTIPAMANMATKYLEVRSKPSDLLPWRTQAYHLFRCEQEAFEIERRQSIRAGNAQLPQLAGAYYRLLDEPERVKAFAQALVLGLVRELEVGIDQKEWVFGLPDNNTPVWLTEGGGDLLRALVTFVQDKKDRRPAMVADLPLPKVQEWIKQQLAATGQPWSECLRLFRETHQDGLLHPGGVGGDRYEDERKAFLALVLDYYLGGA